MSSFDSRPQSPSARPRRKGAVKRVERCCYTFFTHLPLAFVYGLTTWAVYVEVSLGLKWASDSRLGYLLLFLGVAFYGLLNWSYTVAAFTDPGSPLSPPTASSSSRHNYSYLPTHEPPQMPDAPSFTVKASGGARFCKKCQTKKPDRAHHCSTCGRCVLKMDHHCPWLATCVGHRNYKAFILFCTYVSLFCWVCFGVSGTYLWSEVMNEDLARYGGLLSINMVLLAVLSGIFGLVMTGFTAWHISLAYCNQTTIECLEKTRYMNPIRASLSRAAHVFDTNPGQETNLVQKYGQQFTENVANAIPGVTRAEEGEEHSSTFSESSRSGDQITALEALNMSYADIEREREVARYEDYLDEKDSEKLPNAFDLGWRRNLNLLFGDNPWVWFLPVCNTMGDGWHWDANPKWVAELERVRIAREEGMRFEPHRQAARPGHGHPYESTIPDDDNDERHYLSTSNGIAVVPMGGRKSTGKANQVMGRSMDQYSDDYFAGSPSSTNLPLKPLCCKNDCDDTSSLDGLYDNDDRVRHSSDEEEELGTTKRASDEWRDWD